MTEPDADPPAKPEPSAEPDPPPKEADAPPEEAETAKADAETADEARATEGDDASSADTAKPKRKKKKRSRSAEVKPGARAAIDEEGRERPAFLLAFPEDPELEPLIRAFELGNYALVRSEAPRVAERATSADVKAAAEELLRRIEPDPLVKFLLGVAVALFFAVVGYVYAAH